MIQYEEKNLQILNNYRELTLSKFKNGKGPIVDLVRIDIKRNKSATNIQLLKGQNQPLQIEFNPTHPMADKDGFIYRSNVNVVEEMANMISASRAYQTNVQLADAAKSMLSKTIMLGQR